MIYSTKGRQLVLSMIGVALWIGFACSDKENSGTSGKNYDPSRPVKVTEFYPDSGGMATKMIIKGENFGVNPTDVGVYFNEKKAAVVESNGDMLYVIVPKQPGDDCKISVVVGNDSLTLEKTFSYITSVTVSTVAGKVGVSASTDGTLAEAEFHTPRYLVIDAERNIFVSDWRNHRLRQINEASNLVTTVHSGNGMEYPNGPATDADKKVIFVPNDGGNVFLEFDPEKQWAGKKITPRPAEGEEFSIDYKHSLAPNQLDKLIYTRAHNGQLIKFDARTKAAWLVDLDLMPGSDSFLYFHPTKQNLLYISYSKKNCIYTYDLETKEHILYAGAVNEAGYMDGEREYSQFNNPRQICFDKDENLYIADEGNHVIRKIDRNGIVSTVVGIPGVKGYRDGNPDEAMFDTPTGVAIDDEGIIYIADYENRLIRKLAIE